MRYGYTQKNNERDVIKMKKLLPLLILVVPIMLSACSKDEQPKQAQVGPTVATQLNSTVVDNTSPDDSAKIEETGTPEKSGSGRFITDDKRTASIKYTRDFSEGRAWVRLGYDGRILAVIDKQGQLVLLINSNETSMPRWGGDFKDGLAYHKGIKGINNNYNYFIVDSDGNITFEAEDETFMILGYANGRFLAVQHISNFSTNEWQIGAIDKDGNIVVPFKTYQYDVSGNMKNLSFKMSSMDDGTFVSSEYLGDNIFKLQFWAYSVLLNIETQTILSNEDYDQTVRLLTGFENGYATALYTDPERIRHPLGSGEQINANYICKLGTDGSIYDKINNNWTQYILGMNMEFDEGLTFVPFTRGEEGNVYRGFGEDFVYKTGVYYNMNGDVAIDFPEYRGKLNYFGSPFKNGYATLQIKGADGLNYFTAIDRNGNQMFEPRKDYFSLTIADDGQLIARVKSDRSEMNLYHVMDINGDMLMTIYTTASLKDGINISDGMLRMPGAGYLGSSVYINMEDGSILGSYAVSNDNGEPTELFIELYRATQ